MGYGDMLGGGFFYVLGAAAFVGFLAIIGGAVWGVWWLLSHLAWVA